MWKVESGEWRPRYDSGLTLPNSQSGIIIDHNLLHRNSFHSGNCLHRQMNIRTEYLALHTYLTRYIKGTRGFSEGRTSPLFHATGFWKIASTKWLQG